MLDKLFFIFIYNIVSFQKLQKKNYLNRPIRGHCCGLTPLIGPPPVPAPPKWLVWRSCRTKFWEHWWRCSNNQPMRLDRHISRHCGSNLYLQVCGLVSMLFFFGYFQNSTRLCYERKRSLKMSKIFSFLYFLFCNRWRYLIYISITFYLLLPPER